MAASRHLSNLFTAPLTAAQLKQTMDEVRQAILAGVVRGQDVAEPVRKRLNAPLVGPPRFETAREYRTWREQRRTQPGKRSALQWPLGVWLAIGVVVILWVSALLS
jgi:hypothetical protein